MGTNQWLCDAKSIEKSKKHYAHFDVRTDISKCGWYITNPKKVAHHGFYPFIHYVKKFEKYNSSNGKSIKSRDICYSAHIDRCIYQWYSHILNEKYNQRIADDGLSDVAVAYRTNLGKNSVHLAKRAIDFIKQSQNCYIMIGDFTHFFDELNHSYLKERWCDLLGVEQLPDDHYSVFKSITRYSMWELDDLLKLNGLRDTKKDRKILNEKCRVISPQQYNCNRHQIKKNTHDFGIPQGSPISGLLANIYMLEADKKINDVVMQCHGIYMRYSDDFIVILPDDLKEAQQAIRAVLTILSNVKNLTLEPRKTQYFCYTQGELTKRTNQLASVSHCVHPLLNFLGFSFDGSKVSIRAKTVGKYYYKMYRKANHITKCHGYTPKGNHISCKNLYGQYSERGNQKSNSAGHSGNFFSYVDRAEHIFGTDENITRDTRRHMSKIRKALKKRPR